MGPVVQATFWTHRVKVAGALQGLKTATKHSNNLKRHTKQARDGQMKEKVESARRGAPFKVLL